MKVTVTGEYAAKSEIVGKRALHSYTEELELKATTKGEAIFEARGICEALIKQRDPKFSFLRTCGLTKESEGLFGEEPTQTIGVHPSKNFNPHTGKPLDVEAPASNSEPLPEPKRKNKRG